MQGAGRAGARLRDEAKVSLCGGRKTAAKGGRTRPSRRLSDRLSEAIRHALTVCAASAPRPAWLAVAHSIRRIAPAPPAPSAYEPGEASPLKVAIVCRIDIHLRAMAAAVERKLADENEEVVVDGSGRRVTARQWGEVRVSKFEQVGRTAVD